jgi:DNA-binding MarR family transcriptional regulator
MDVVKDHREPPLVALMEQLWRRIKSELDVAARELAPDLRPSHVRLLSLTPASGSRLGDLASKAGMTAQSLGEFVDTLSQAGYAEVVPDPADRRARLVRPTPRGAQIGQAMNARVHDLEGHWSRSFSHQQWRAFREMLISLGRPDGSSESHYQPVPASSGPKSV